MRKNQIYVSVDSMNYWWGIYGLREKVNWEDITIYDQVDHEYKKVARTCICTKEYFENSLSELENDFDEKDYVSDIKKFLNKNECIFRYEYDNPESEDFYEVPFEAERNEKGIKPCYIEIWNRNKVIDATVIKECVTLFCKKFLNINVDKVKFRDVVSFEEAAIEFIKHCELFDKDFKIDFSDEVVNQLEVEWKKPREKVLEILNKSTK